MSFPGIGPDPGMIEGASNLSSPIGAGPMRLQYMTGLDEDEIEDLASVIDTNIRVDALPVPPVGQRCGLGPSNRLAITLMLLRHNLTEQVVGDMWGISQPQVCVIKSLVEDLIDMALSFIGIALGEAAATRVLIADGTFVPTGNRKATKRENYSGKRHCQCLSIQVACDLQGRLVATSRPVAGSRHDSAAIELVRWKDILADATWLADSAYCATNAITPMKKPLGRELTQVERERNHALARLRSAVEHCNATVKQWRILGTGYRRRLSDPPALITLVTKLELFRQGW